MVSNAFLRLRLNFNPDLFLRLRLNFNPDLFLRLRLNFNPDLFLRLNIKTNLASTQRAYHTADFEIASQFHVVRFSLRFSLLILRLRLNFKKSGSCVVRFSLLGLSHCWAYPSGAVLTAGFITLLGLSKQGGF